MAIFNPLAVSKFILLSTVFSTNNAFVPSSIAKVTTTLKAETLTFEKVDSRTGKPTGTSFLPAEAVERASQGSPIEKSKLEKDGTSAFVDVYEYARKIREGEMTWEEVEKADLNTVSV
jgi:ferredoxin-nitrite reductase